MLLNDDGYLTLSQALVSIEELQIITSKPVHGKNVQSKIANERTWQS